jgi:SAM-dependent methyltransferase
MESEIQQTPRSAVEQPVVLHVGCGPTRQDSLPGAFKSPVWRELRYDIDPKVAPDIVGSITDMSRVASDSVHALYNSHVIEHLYAHEVPVALAEFRRVLRPDGFLVVTCPDMQAIAELVAKGQLVEPAYMSAMGPISPIDMIWGHRGAMAAGNLYMAHRCGFTAQSLHDQLGAAGFACAIVARTPGFNLWALATKGDVSDDDLRLLSEHYLELSLA